jgi:metal-responsive CopG/Arc/MetJ family transcriptional regulator
MRRRGKVAVTISNHLLAEVERLRKRSGESRSLVFERALAAYLAAGDRAASARRYVEGYRRRPERPAEVRAALVTALGALAAEEWDAAR